MAGTRIVTKNHLTVAGTSIIAQTGSYDAQFPTANLLIKDRYMPCSATGAGTNSVDFDLGASPKVIHVVGYMAFKSAGLFPTSVTVQASSSVPPTGLVTVATLNLSQGLPRDQGLWLPAPRTERYWRFSMSSSFNPYSIGKFVVGEGADFGRLYSPGSRDTVLRTRVHNEGVFGHDMTTTTGPNRHAYRILMERITQSHRDILIDACATSPFIMWHPFNGLCEVELADDRAGSDHVWGVDGGTHIFDVELDLVTLP